MVTDAPLTHVDAETFVADGLSYSVFPPEGEGEQPIYSIHQSQESMACPKNQCRSCINWFMYKYADI